MIKVEKMGRRYGLEVTAGEEKVTFTFAQLDYFSRNKVATLSTAYREGRLILDVGLACFYNLKYGLKEVKGLGDSEGGPYVLEFDDGVDQLTDNCVNEILACPISDKLLYAADQLGSHIPKEIIDPVTSKPVEGLEVIPPEKTEGALKKKK